MSHFVIAESRTGCFNGHVTTAAHGWNRGIILLALVPVFAVLTLGLAFTIFGEISALLAVISLVAGLVALRRSSRSS
jgi:hypothetical protein